MDGQLPFPELASAPARTGRPKVITFAPRPAARRRQASRLDGEGLAERLQHDVQRLVAHRRRMLAHLRGTVGYSRDIAK